MFEVIEAPRRFWPMLPFRYIAHCLLAGLVPVLLGFKLDAYLYETYDVSIILTTAGICSTVIGAALGFSVGVWRRDRVATFAFIPTLLFFLDGLYEDITFWSKAFRGTPLVHFIVVNTFGIRPGCVGDCFGAIAVTLLCPSLAYSLGAWLAIWHGRRRTAGR